MQSGPPKGSKRFPVEISDEALIGRYNRGDAKALSELVERYRRPLYSFLWRMTESQADSDEIFQDTWLRIITKSKGFRQERFKGWIFKIAHNLVIDWSRRRRKEVSLDSPPAGGDEDSQTMGDKLEQPGPGPENLVDGKAIGHAIKKALAGLTEEQREVFVLRMEADMAFKDIARIQKVSINTALSRMQYALVNLRRALKDYQPGGDVS